jgi:subtilase family serine protease
MSEHGTATAGPSTLTISSIGTFKVSSIPPGRSATFSWSICRVAVYTATVDRDQAVTESNETNNTATLRNTC